MATPGARATRYRTVLILAVLLGFLAGAAAFAWWGWNLVGGDMPPAAWGALVVGVVATVAIGCGLMFLIFYSSRQGYDHSVRRTLPPDDGD